jgi:hypothetical protein
MATGNFDGTLKAMFGRRGESNRIREAEALGKPAYAAMGLEADFDTAVNGLRYCLNIRNQYAHHNFWADGSDKLAIANLESVARRPGPFNDLRSLTRHHIDDDLLKRQEQYFHYTERCLDWINFESQFKRGLLDQNHRHKPLPLPKPKLHLP